MVEKMLSNLESSIRPNDQSCMRMKMTHNLSWAIIFRKPLDNVFPKLRVNRGKKKGHSRAHPERKQRARPRKADPPPASPLAQGCLAILRTEAWVSLAQICSALGLP